MTRVAGRMRMLPLGLLGVGLLVGGSAAAMAQPLDLSQGGPITITARDGLEWHQEQQEVIASGDARAVRENVTVSADRLIAYYRKNAAAGTGSASPSGTQPSAAKGASVQGTPQGTHQGTPGQKSTVQQAADTGSTGQKGAAPPAAAQSGLAADTDTSGTEIYRVRAEGHVVIFTATDRAQGDVAVYDIDQAVMVMTGHDLRLTTPTEVLTARDTLEYWPQKHMAVARGNAVVVTSDARRVAADVLVAYTTPTAGAPSGQASGPKGGKASATPVATTSGTNAPGMGAIAGGSASELASSGKLEKVEAFGHVSVRTPTDTAMGDRAVYVPDTGIARLADNVRITRGQNQLNGQQAEVDMHTGIARLLRGGTERVTGLVVPNDTTNRSLSTVGQPQAGGPTAATKPTGGKP